MRVLITRSGGDAEELHGILAGKGLEALIEPMLEAEYLKDGDLEVEGVAAFLATSTNGARALGKATARRDIPVFAMGDSAKRTVLSAGFEDVAATAGDSGELVRLLQARIDPGKGAVLHASGAKPAAEMKEAFEDEGYVFRHETLFATRSPDALSDTLLQWMREGGLDAILFYSPMTVGVFIRLVEAAGLAQACAKVTLFCLSDGIANATKSLVWREVRVPPEPNQEALLRCLDEFVAGE